MCVVWKTIWFYSIGSLVSDLIRFSIRVPNTCMIECKTLPQLTLIAGIQFLFKPLNFTVKGIQLAEAYRFLVHRVVLTSFFSRRAGGHIHLHSVMWSNQWLHKLTVHWCNTIFGLDFLQIIKTFSKTVIRKHRSCF